MTRLGGLAAILAAAAAAFGLSAGPAHALTILSSIEGGKLGFIVDGTSNTVQVGEASRLAICVDHVGFGQPVGSITDGSSNTLLIGGGGNISFSGGFVRPRQPIGAILDGTSNTILIGETPADALCFGDVEIVSPIQDGTSNTILIGEASRFDACFRNVAVGSIQDGTSNTIIFGEVSATPVCFEDVEVAETLRAPVGAVPVPAAGGLALLACAIAAIGVARRRA